MHDKNIKEIAKRLRSEGRTFREISEILDITIHAARGMIVYNNKKHISKRGPKYKLKGKFQ